MFYKIIPEEIGNTLNMKSCLLFNIFETQQSIEVLPLNFISCLNCWIEFPIQRRELDSSFLNSTVAFKMVGKTFKKPAMSVPKQPASLVCFEKLENGKILHEIVSGYNKQELSPERVHFSFICAYEKVFEARAKVIIDKSRGEQFLCT